MARELKKCAGLLVTLVFAYGLISWVPLPSELSIIAGVAFGALMGRFFNWLID